MGYSGRSACPLGCGGELKLSSAEGKTDLELRVIPLIKQDAMFDYSMQGGYTAVFVSRPGTLQLPWKKVASVYGLSPAEAKLVVILAEGCRPEEEAERLFVSINTVRSQLKSVFAKTGIRRQPELVAKLLSGMLAWCKEEE
jgi:DNA-binding CsgD family transcriptional regulator